MPLATKPFTNTEYERLALTNRINLSDGHARHSLSQNQRKIIQSSLGFFDIALSRPQAEIEEEFLFYFFQCAKQNSWNKKLNTFLNYSASAAIKIVAQYCRIRKLKVYLIEPCFDNIRHILQTEGVIIIPIQEEQLYNFDSEVMHFDQHTAIWLVQPNNPTGFCLDKFVFVNLINKIAECNATLIIDFCFRFYANTLKSWDQYSVLKESGLTFLCIEDTGKTWGVADNKVGITICSTDSVPIIHRLHDELLLNLSPLTLLLLTEFIKDTVVNGFENTVRKGVETNRFLLFELIQKDLFTQSSRWSQNVPMELVGLPNNIPSKIIWNELRKMGVDILPCHNYFWSKPSKGEPLIRIPLSRPFHDFETAVPIIKKVLLNLNQK